MLKMWGKRKRAEHGSPSNMPRPKKGWKGGSLFLADLIGIFGGNLKAGTRARKAGEPSDVQSISECRSKVAPPARVSTNRKEVFSQGSPGRPKESPRCQGETRGLKKEASMKKSH
jgi:hypothetical protein